MTTVVHRLLKILAALVLAVLPLAAAHPAVPAFAVQDLGAGVPVDVNSAGAIVGQDGYTPGMPWVLRGGTRTYLPLPAGVSVATVNRINDAGVVLGQLSNRPAVWRPDGTGYALELVALPAGATVGNAIDATGAGKVLLSFGTPGVTYTGLQYVTYKPYLYDRAAGTLLDLTTVYAVAGTSFPDLVDMTESGRILAATGEILEPDFTVTPAPAYPPRPPGGYSWIAFRAQRLNDAGAFVGRAVLSSSQGYAQVVRHDPVAGWTVLGGLNANVSSLGISEPGDALFFANYLCPLNYGIGFAVAGGGSYCLDDLLLQPGWSFTSFSAKGAIAAGGLVAAYGYSAAAGAYRLALLSRAGDLPAPPAVSLAAAPHPGTWTQPYDAISLSWTSAGPLARQYAIERRDPGATTFAEVARIGATVTTYDDQSIRPLLSYAYRVRAVGLAGPGPYSNEASATAPAAMDRVAPEVTITSPADGATVTGTVTVSATFSDNVAVTYAQFEFQPNMGNGIICSRYPAAGTLRLTLSCRWDSSKVAYQAPSAIVTAYGYDAIGNWVSRSVTVNVTYAPKKGRTR